jgi:hypothetical protein
MKTFCSGSQLPYANMDLPKLLSHEQAQGFLSTLPQTHRNTCFCSIR